MVRVYKAIMNNIKIMTEKKVDYVNFLLVNQV